MRCGGCCLGIPRGVTPITFNKAYYCGKECVTLAQQKKSLEMKQASPRQNFLSFDSEAPHGHETVSL